MIDFELLLRQLLSLILYVVEGEGLSNLSMFESIKNWNYKGISFFLI